MDLRVRCDQIALFVEGAVAVVLFSSYLPVFSSPLSLSSAWAVAYLLAQNFAVPQFFLLRKHNKWQKHHTHQTQ